MIFLYFLQNPLKFQNKRYSLSTLNKISSLTFHTYRDISYIHRNSTKFSHRSFYAKFFCHFSELGDVFCCCCCLILHSTFVKLSIRINMQLSFERFREHSNKNHDFIYLIFLFEITRIRIPNTFSRFLYTFRYLFKLLVSKNFLYVHQILFRLIKLYMHYS